jgi:membrane peptidoglycan carboxypeptidase
MKGRTHPVSARHAGPSRHGRDGGLDDLFDGGLPSAVATVRRAGLGRRLGRLPRLFGWSVVAGLVVAALVAPFVLPPSYAARQAVYAWEDLPAELPLTAELPQRSVMLDAAGKPFAVFFGQDRVPLRLDRVSPAVIDALLATEDDRFYEHGALDLKALVRAVIRTGSTDSVQGGSGITQQYVKNLLLSEAATPEQQRAVTEQTITRKIRELRYAVALEDTLTKDEILERYLNTVNFGDGAYGIGAAAQHYFGTPAGKLTVSQAALLVGILKSPTNFNPVDNPGPALTRRNVVLDRMLATGRITAAEHAAARAEEVVLTITDRAQGCGASRFPFFCQYVLDSIASDPVFGATPEARQELLYRGGLTIRTTLDREAMAIAQAAADRALEPTNRVATGIAVVRPGTGEVVAIATNKRWGRAKAKGQTQIVLPVRPAYQPGSTFKPFTLATALEKGFSLSTRYDTPDGYKPARQDYPAGGFHNDNNRNNGVLDAYQATARSVNTWYIQLQEWTGVVPVAKMATRLGVSSLPMEGPRRITPRNASLTLGAYEVSPLDMASAYATFASGGIACDPVVITSMTDRSSRALAVPVADCRRVITPYVAAAVTDVMTGVFRSGGTGNGLGLDGRDAAGKTGTTNNSAATWFAGFTPQYATAVWIGDPRGGQRYPLKNVSAYGRTFGTVYGSSIAGPIWQETMRGLHEGLPRRAFVDPAIASLTGLAPAVPDVRGLERDAAVSALLRAGYDVAIAPDTAPADPSLPAGVVADQAPPPSVRAPYGATVTLTLTDGSVVDVWLPDMSELAPSG